MSAPKNMKKSFQNTQTEIAETVRKTFQPEDAVLEEIRIRCHKEGLPPIQVGDMDALHLEVITRAIGAKKAVEIGTLRGYSGVSIARGLAKDGKLFTFEYHPHHAKVAKESFKKAHLENQVQIFVGAALDNLPKIEKSGPFDLVFIDADKTNYTNYLNWAEKNLKLGGVILADNTFAVGFSAQDTKAIQKFNTQLSQNPHFRATILPTGEGLTFAVKISSA